MRVRAVCLASVWICLTFHTAVAQNAGEMFNLFSGMIQAAIITNARTEWSKIPPNQITCVEGALQQQGHSVAALIQNGIAPGDSRVSGIVGNCRPQRVVAPSQPTTTHQDAMSIPMPSQAPQEKSPYVVEGLALRGRVAFDSQEYQQYACEASEQYPGFTRCSRQRGPEDSIALLHSADGTVEYINRYIEPASFKPGEIDSELKRLSQRFSGQAKIRRAPHRPNQPDGMIAVWGDVKLDELNSDSVNELLTTGSPHKGILVDYLGHFIQSAKNGLPVYSLSGGPGFVYATSYDGKGRGSLRFFAIDPEGLESGIPVSQSNPSPSEADKKCQSNETQQRLDGCTVIVDAKGKGFKTTLAAALDARCWAYNDLQQFERGLEDCDASIKLNSKYPYAYNNRGTSLFGLGRTSESIASFTKSIELKPTFIYPYLGRAQAFAQAGDKAKVRQDYEHALKIDRNNQEARDGLLALGPTEKIKAAQRFLEDAKVCLKEQQNPIRTISEIGKEGENLERAILKLDEDAAVKSLQNLRDLLDQVDGFGQCEQRLQAAREQKTATELAEAKALGERNICFIDTYLRSNLGSPKTANLIKSKQTLETAVKATSIDEISTANESLQNYVRGNALSDSYQLIIQDCGNRDPSARPIGRSDKSRFLIEGPGDDVVLLYNGSPAASSVSKDLKGDLTFQNNVARLCFGQESLDIALVLYVDNIFSRLGAQDLATELSPCDLSKVGGTIDLIAFQRKGLLRERDDYVRDLIKLVENDTFKLYQIISDFNSTLEQRDRLSLTLENDIEKNSRSGYGIIAIRDSYTVCAVTPAKPEQLAGLENVVVDDRDLVEAWRKGVLPDFIKKNAPTFRSHSDWQFVETTAEGAFFGVQRSQCSYVAGQADVLRTVMLSLRREKINYSVSPVWWTDVEVEKATADILQGQPKQPSPPEDRKCREGEDQRARDLQAQLRKENSPRASGLMSSIHTFVKEVSEKPDLDRNGRVIDRDGRLPNYVNWLNGRLLNRWETTDVSSEIADFGAVEWRGRPLDQPRSLDAIIVKSVIKQKNADLGSYEKACFMFGLMDDPEFNRQREPFVADCGAQGSKAIRSWQTANKFESKWTIGSHADEVCKPVQQTANPR